MPSDTYTPPWSVVQRVVDLIDAAGGRALAEAHLPQRVNYHSYASQPHHVGGVVSHTSGCKMHARVSLPDPDGPGNTTLCAVCDAVDRYPRVARELERGR